MGRTGHLAAVEGLVEVVTRVASALGGRRAVGEVGSDTCRNGVRKYG